jgi:hypothetical protein
LSHSGPSVSHSLSGPTNGTLLIKGYYVGYKHNHRSSIVVRGHRSDREVPGSIPRLCAGLKSFCHPARPRQIGNRTRPSGRPVGPGCQVVVPPVRSAMGPGCQAIGPARQVDRGTHYQVSEPCLPGRTVSPACQVGPCYQAHGTSLSASGTRLPGRSVSGTRPWDSL